MKIKSQPKVNLTSKVCKRLRALIEVDLANHSLNSDPKNHEAIQFLTAKLPNDILKKLEVEDPILEEVAFATFSEFNIRGKGFKIEPKSLWDEALIEQVSYMFSQALTPLSECDGEWLDFIAERGRFGPGSSAKTYQPCAYKQFGSVITYTSKDLISPWKKVCERRGLWSSEYQRQRNCGFKRLIGAHATFVPKDTAKYRMVATEPSLDMFFQLGLHEILKDILKEQFGCDLTTQEPKNKAFARRGSVDGSFSTIDSTSASDSMYLDSLFEVGVIPKWFMLILNTIKSRFITYKGKNIRLSMCGTQGCGYTFSLMTLLLYCIVDSVYIISDIVPHPGNRAVYGDDIICLTTEYSLVIRALELFGFVPNKAKSFSSGPFRESCGGDYYAGYNVRSLYIRNLTTVQDVCIAHNNLLVYGALHNIYFWESIRYLANQARSRGAPLVPFSFPEDSGLYTLRAVVAPDGTTRESVEAFVPYVPQLPVHSDVREGPKGADGAIHTDALVRCAIGGYVSCDNKGRFSCDLRVPNTKYALTEVPVSDVDILCIPTGWPLKRGSQEFNLYAMRIAFYMPLVV